MPSPWGRELFPPRSSHEVIERAIAHTETTELFSSASHTAATNAAAHRRSYSVH